MATLIKTDGTEVIVSRDFISCKIPTRQFEYTTSCCGFSDYACDYYHYVSI